MKFIKETDDYYINSKYGKVCKPLYNEGYTACFNCKHKECIHTANYIHPSEADYVESVYNAFYNRQMTRGK